MSETTTSGHETQETSTQTGGEATPAWAKDLSENTKTLSETMKGLIKIAKQGREQAEVTPPAVTPPPEEEEADPDSTSLEGMSRTEFANFIIGRVAKEVNKQFVLPINSRLDETQRSVVATTMANEIEVLKVSNPDLGEWKDDIIGIARRTPGLTPTQMLALARDANPTKAQALKDKYKIGVREPRPDEPSFRPRKINYGGATPGSSGDRGSRPRNMEPGEAARQAWDKVVKETGVEPDFDDRF